MTPSHPPLHDRVVAAAAALTCEVGWSGVTMGRLAERVGVSRQTVYNEVGSKPRLAEEMVLAELATFLATVDAAFDRHPEALADALRAAVVDVLTLARSNALLEAVVSASYGGGSELLPLLTTRNDALVLAATGVLRARVVDYPLAIDGRRLDAALDLLVRLVVSHVVHPGGTPEATADDIVWMAGRTLME